MTSRMVPEKKRHANVDVDKEREEEDIAASSVKKLKSEDLNSSHPQDTTAMRNDLKADTVTTSMLREDVPESVEKLQIEFSRLRLNESKNVETGNAQYYVVAYASSSKEDIKKCIVTKKWNRANRKFIGKAWDLNSGPVYLFFTVSGTNQLCAVATLCPDQDYDSYIGINFLKVIDLPVSRYTDDCYMNCKPTEIRTMDPEWGKTTLETLLEYTAEDVDKSFVDDINESLIVRFRQQKVGIRNLGNTCYMNCILQCLARVPWKPLSKYPKDELVTEFFRVMSCLSEPGDSRDLLNPQLLRAQIAKFSSRFATHQQQDAHELLLCLLGLLNKKMKNAVANKECEENCFQGQFSGELQNTVEFECNHRVSNVQPFFAVSLSIPKNCLERGSASVADCLELFTAEERMDEENKAMCLDCSGEPKKCTLRTQFLQLPSILILHVQRTDFSKPSKLDTVVSMPVNGLQLQDLNESKHEYNLFAVCNHYGSSEIGHYTADVKCHGSNKWFTYSDSNICESNAMPQTEFSSASASILFYAKN